MQIAMKITRVARKILFTISAILIAIATALACVNAVSRFFGVSFNWMEEICTYFIVLMVYLALAHLEGTGDQLCITAIDLWVKGKGAQRFLNYLRGVLTSAALVILGYYGVIVMLKAFKRSQLTDILHFPRGVLYGIALLGFAVAVIVWIVIMICNKGEFDDAD